MLQHKHKIITICCLLIWLPVESAAVVSRDIAGGAASGAHEPSTDLVSTHPDGGQFESRSFNVVISADGRFAAFVAGVPTDACAVAIPALAFCPVAFHRDLQTGTTQVVSADPEGRWVWAELYNGTPAISADGRYVAFIFDCGFCGRRPIPGGPLGIYIRDMDTGLIEFIDMPTTNGLPPNEVPKSMAISSDGRIVTFESAATNLVPGGVLPGGSWGRHVYVYDRDQDQVDRVSSASNGTLGNASSRAPVISADGRHVAFTSEATNLTSGDSNSVADIFVHDRHTGMTERVSVAFDGSEANGVAAVRPVISADGRHVAFTSEATNLVPDYSNDGSPSVFVRDRISLSTELISIASDGSHGIGVSHYPAISADGRFIAFYSYAANLVPDDTNSHQDVFVRDRAAGITERVSVTADTAEADGSSDERTPGVSADGRFVVFTSAAANLVPDDNNGEVDAFIRDRGVPVDVELKITPDLLDFGEVMVGTTSVPQTATLANTGGDEATGLTFSNTGNGFAADTSDCGATLPPGESCELSVTFTPTVPGPASATLQVDSNDSSVASLFLSGEGGDGTQPPNPIFDDRFEQDEP